MTGQIHEAGPQVFNSLALLYIHYIEQAYSVQQFNFIKD